MRASSQSSSTLTSSSEVTSLSFCERFSLPEEGVDSDSALILLEVSEAKHPIEAEMFLCWSLNNFEAQKCYVRVVPELKS